MVAEKQPPSAMEENKEKEADDSVSDRSVTRK